MKLVIIFSLLGLVLDARGTNSTNQVYPTSLPTKTIGADLFLKSDDIDTSRFLDANGTFKTFDNLNNFWDC
jgi:hypothetical protein